MQWDVEWRSFLERFERFDELLSLGGVFGVLFLSRAMVNLHYEHVAKRLCYLH